jgi:hypothetical protein
MRSAAHRVDDAAEFDESPVAGMFDDPAAVLEDPWRDDFPAIGEEAEMGALLVGAHQAGVADDVGSKDRRQPAFEPRIIGRPQAPEHPGCLGYQPLYEDGLSPGQNAGDPAL